MAGNVSVSVKTDGELEPQSGVLSSVREARSYHFTVRFELHRCEQCMLAAM
jgi:hypothetical protein